MNKRELDNSSGDDSYDDRMPVFLNRSEMDDSSDNESDDESDICDNIKNNEYWSDKGLDYAEYLNEEDNYDEYSMTDDEMSDLIYGYKIDDSST